MELSGKVGGAGGEGALNEVGVNASRLFEKVRR